MTLFYFLLALITGIFPHESDGFPVDQGGYSLQQIVESPAQCDLELTSERMLFMQPAAASALSLTAEIEFEIEVNEGKHSARASSSFFTASNVATLCYRRLPSYFFNRHLFRPPGASKIILFQVFLI